ncbi:hypothetical protein [Nocardia sp. NPDC051570]|uniref:hypothetical protein n=1 Tax=Nocardia sp. NPDC051570 TaxID=3364324 RepID=UPI00379DE9E4
MAALFPLPPVRLALPADAYADVPACWWSRNRWIAHNLALYDQHYAMLRRNRMVDSVSRKTFQAYLIAESSGADFTTGRGTRMTIAQLEKAVGMSESTMHRCRRVVNKFGTRTVVFRGRQRTREERLASWKRNDRSRGWAAVAALHESVVMPVDNAIMETQLEQGFGTPPEHSEGSFELSPQQKTSSPQNMTERRAPRGHDKKGRMRRQRPAYDQKAVRLAASIRRDDRLPLWVRQIRPGHMAATVTRKAVAGWLVDDIFGAFEEFRISGKALIERPTNPPGYLRYILNQIPDDVPPALLDRARTAALEETERAERARQREVIRAAVTAAAGPNSLAYQEARKVVAEISARTTGRSRARIRESDEARRELARQAQKK